VLRRAPVPVSLSPFSLSPGREARAAPPSPVAVSAGRPAPVRPGRRAARWRARWSPGRGPGAPVGRRPGFRRNAPRAAAGMRHD